MGNVQWETEEEALVEVAAVEVAGVAEEAAGVVSSARRLGVDGVRIDDHVRLGAAAVVHGVRGEVTVLVLVVGVRLRSEIGRDRARSGRGSGGVLVVAWSSAKMCGGRCSSSAAWRRGGRRRSGRDRRRWRRGHEGGELRRGGGGRACCALK